MRLDDATILDVLNAARLAVGFTEDMDKPTFLADEKTQSAVSHQLLILGEAVKRLSPRFRSEHPQIPWKKISGMRDILIHEYDSVDLDQVWRTVTRDLLPLIKEIERVVE